MDNKHRAIIQTLAYYDVFDYPLTLDEIEKYLVGSKKLTKKTIQHTIVSLHNVGQQKGFYFFSGRERITAIRHKRQDISAVKIAKAHKIGRLISLVSSIMYIGLSGSLAMQHAKKEDDIDLFVITKSGTLWTTRSIVLVMLLLTGSLRMFGRKKVQDTICINMWVDGGHMAFDKDRQNSYTAHEIVQMQTVFSRHNTYRKFLAVNAWVQDFLPNTTIAKIGKVTTQAFSIQPVEYIAKRLQLWYMKKHQTSETIREGFVAFHPQDYTVHVLSLWEKRMKKYEI